MAHPLWVIWSVISCCYTLCSFSTCWDSCNRFLPQIRHLIHKPQWIEMVSYLCIGWLLAEQVNAGTFYSGRQGKWWDHRGGIFYAFVASTLRSLVCPQYSYHSSEHMEGLIHVWYLIDFKYYPKQKMHFGSRLCTGDEGEDEMKNGSEVSNLSHYERCRKKIKSSDRGMVLKNANAGMSLGCTNIIFVVSIVCSGKGIRIYIYIYFFYLKHC